MHYEKTPLQIRKNTYEFDGEWFKIEVTFNSKGFVEQTTYSIPEFPLASYSARSWSESSTWWGLERCSDYWKNYG